MYHSNTKLTLLQWRSSYLIYFFKFIYQCTGSCCGSGGQLQRRTVQCMGNQNGHLVLLPDEACSGPKPSTSTTCKRTDCPHWSTSEWGACPTPTQSTCGLRTRVVQCTKGGSVVAQEECCMEQPLEAESCYPCGEQLWLLKPYCALYRHYYYSGYYN